MKPDNEYRRSLFDKLGPEAADVFRLGSLVMIPAVAGILIGIALAVRAHYSAMVVVLCAVLGAVVAGGGTALITWGISRGSGGAFGAFIQPKGDYKRDYSREDSLVARGDVDAAIAAYAEIAEDDAENLEAPFRAAELLAKHGPPERAAALYRDIQTRATQRGDDVRASNRLIDLYLAWPEHEGRALRELRRLVDLYPDTEVAAKARAALDKLKAERFA